MATRKPFRKSQLIAFDNAAAGHDGVLSDAAGQLVVKPCKQSEVDFYESAAMHPDILPFLPTYMGRLSLGELTSQGAGTLILPGEISREEPFDHSAQNLNVPVMEHAWAPSGGAKIQTELAIVMQNVTAGYVKPNILDVKLGARLWDDQAPIEKRNRLDKSATESTSKPLGFRIAGMKTYQVANTEGDLPAQEYKIYDKTYGREFSATSVIHGFEDYFLLESNTKASGPVRKVIRRFIADLEDLVVAIEQEESRMYSSSILLVYEGHLGALQTAFQREPEIIASIQSVNDIEDTSSAGSQDSSGDGEEMKLPSIQCLKLIDFAHAKWTPGRGPDENLLFGVRNVIKLLNSLLPSKQTAS